MSESVGLMYLITLEFHSYVSLEFLYMFPKVTTILLSSVNSQTFLHYLCNFWDQPYLYGNNSST